ncbi:acetyltransferase [Streptomyces longisporoflavus]|uniref:GNAT family N-acetyltransferase n=1 Tax=Streptomyces longisporoflavus TaxID=28044 RepID=UPI00167D970C|nr:GNAT family protein [Streptomyces longisporoflavus]GGV35840.1 acetyltransferase [Streptomyces longisporoflavus]
MSDSTRPLAEGPHAVIRPYTYADGPEFTARARESRQLHSPWLFPPITDAAYAQYAGALIEGRDRAGFLVCERGREWGRKKGRGRAAGGAIAGFININNIVEGAFLCGALGYGAFAHAAGRGLMSEGVGLVTRYAFDVMKLHRLEINVQPGNAASIALARRCGYRLEGFSPDFLYIDGAWRDHERWALTATE